MATDRLNPWDVDEFPAGATNLVQFGFAALNSSGNLVLPAGGALAVVVYDAPALTTAGAPGPYVEGDFYTCAFGGMPKVVAGSALNPFVQVMTNSSGEAVAATTGNVILGVTLEAASGAGSLVPILFSLAGAVHA